MNKKLIFAAALMVSVVSVYAEVDPKAMPIVQDIQQGRNNANAIEDLYVKDDATIVGDASVGGALAVTGALTPASASVTGDLTVGDDLILSVQSQNLATSGVLQVKSSMLIYGVGQAASATNSITVAAPGTGMTGKLAVIAVGTTSSNLLAIADTAPCDLSAAFEMGVGDTLTLFATSATTWVEVSRSNN